MAEKAFLPKGTLVLWLKRGRDSPNEVGGEEKSRKREGLMSPFQLELYPYGKRRSLKSFKTGNDKIRIAFEKDLQGRGVDWMQGNLPEG